MTRIKENTKNTKGTVSVLGFAKENDGKDHINIHSMGNTELGKLLSHFAHTPFTHEYFGPFYSIEGFWYFARSGFDELVGNRLRYLSGYRAKQMGRQLSYKWYKEFKEDIIAANYQKIIQNDELSKMFVESKLPFDHYYTFGPNSLLVTPQSAAWLVEGFEDIRLAMKEGVVPSVWLEAEKRYIQMQKK